MSSKYRKARRAKRYVPKPIRTPLMGPACDRISLDMHLALARLCTNPTQDARDDLADVLNKIGFAIQDDPRFAEEHTVLNEAGQVLTPYQPSAPLPEGARHVLTHAATVIDTILGLLDWETLRAAEVAYVAAARAVRAQAAMKVRAC